MAEKQNEYPINFGESKSSPPQLFSEILRVILYSLFLCGITFIIYLDTQGSGGNKFIEQSWTEYTQEALLFLISLIFILLGRFYRDYLSLSLVLAFIPCLAFIREFDFFLDEYVFDGAWQLLVLIVILVLSLSIFRNHTGLRGAITDYVSTRSFGMYLSGFLTTFVFSRIYGMDGIWKNLMEGGYLRSVRNASEESVELLGYSILFFSAVEFLFYLRKKNRVEEPKWV